MVSAALLLAALILAPIIGGAFGELTNAILQIFVLSAVSIRLMSRRAGSKTSARVPGFIPLVIFLAGVLISVIFSTSLYLSIKQLLFISACLAAYMLAADISRDEKAAAALVWGLVLSALGICAMEIRNYAMTVGGGARFWKSVMGSGDQWRVFGPFANPNFFSGFLVLVIPLTLGVYLSARRRVLTAASGVALALECIALLLTGAKFGVIAGAVAVLAFFALVIATRSLRRADLKRLAIIAIVLIPLMVVFSGSVRSRINQAEAGGTQVHSTEFRKYTWKATLNMIKQHPLTGVGLGAFETAFPRYEIAGFTTHAHDSYLQTSAESGIVALGAFLAVLLCLAGRSAAGIYRSRAVDAAEESSEPAEADSITWNDLVPRSAWRLMNCALWSSLLGSAVRNLVDSDWYVMGVALPFWILAGLLAARSGAVSESSGTKRGGRYVLSAVCGVLILASVSLGLGDLAAPDEFGAAGPGSEIMRGYELASTLSPLNPKYLRELARCRAYIDNDFSGAMATVDRAIKLDPNNSENYFDKGTIAMQGGDAEMAAESLKKASELNPNNTQTLYTLAMVYRSTQDTARFESTLKKLLAIEKTPFEMVTGVPEMVDITYAYAHSYFGHKYLDEAKYHDAVGEFSQAVSRLKRWSSNKQMLEVKRTSGKLSKEEEQQNFELLRNSCYGLADSYSRLGDTAKADEARKEGDAVKAGD